MEKHKKINIIAAILIFLCIVLFLPALLILRWFALLVYAVPMILTIVSLRIK
jgi:hypothetical protein